MAIQSFADRNTMVFFKSGRLGKGVRWRNVRNIVLRKLDMLHYAAIVGDLRAPPGNRLEALKGRLKGHYSIRINDQWRIVFKWGKQGPEDVRITDYH